MLNRRTGGSAAAIDVHRARAAIRDIKFPDLEVALENDRAAVVTDAGPKDAAVFELSDLTCPAADFPRPDILRAAAIGHVENRAVIFAPHGPDFLGAALTELFITCLRAESHQPDFAFINVAVSFAPPLRAAKAVTHKGEAAAIALWGAEIFVRVSVGADLHRRAAFAADAIHIGAAGIATG